MTEFFPSNPNLVGMNRNSGETIFIRLRPADDKSSFLPLEESLVGTLLHEFTHNVHGPHHKQFYEFLDKLQDEYDVLRTGWYTGEGFLSEGKRAGSSRNLPPHLAREKALQGAQRRNHINSIMGPADGNRLGVGKSTFGKTPKQMAADAAERRALDDKACGHGEAVSDISVEEEMDKATLNSTTLETTSDKNPPATAASKAPTATRNSKDEMEAGTEDDSDIEIILPTSEMRALPSPEGKRKGKDRLPADSSQSRKRSSAQTKDTELSQTVSKRVCSTWLCQACTFENDKPLGLACEICGTARAVLPGKENNGPPEGSARVAEHRAAQPQNRGNNIEKTW